MENSYRLPPTTEILTSYLSSACASDESLYALVKEDAVAFILSYSGLDFSHLSVSVFDNTATEVALVLPYYEVMEQSRSEILADSSVEDIAGGEILGASFFFGSLGLAFGFGSFTAFTASFFTPGAIAGGVLITGLAVGASVAAIAGTGALIGTAVHYGTASEDDNGK